jgi:hypothetical protein
MMMKILALGVLGASLSGYYSLAQAATVTYDIKVTIDSSTTGALLGNMYFGRTSYDDAGLDSQLQFQDLPLTSFLFNFENVDYGLTGDPSGVASFLQGNFLGVSYTAPDFVISPGAINISNSSFFYVDPNSNLQASGIVEYHLIPEGKTVTALLLLGILGLGVTRR